MSTTTTASNVAVNTQNTATPSESATIVKELYTRIHKNKLPISNVREMVKEALGADLYNDRGVEKVDYKFDKAPREFCAKLITTIKADGAYLLGVYLGTIKPVEEVVEEAVESVSLIPGAEPVMITQSDKAELETLVNALSGQIEVAKAAWGDDEKVLEAITTTANHVQGLIVSDDIKDVEQVKIAFMAALQAEKIIKKLIEAKQKKDAKEAEAAALQQAADEKHQQELAAKREAAVGVVEKLKTTITDNGRKIQTLENLSFDEFALISDYPYNRDAKKRAKSASKTHLHGSITSHLQTVFAIVVLDKEVNADLWAKVEEEAAVSGEPCTLPYMKVDGHSRTEAIETGKLAKPEEITVTAHKQAGFTTKDVWDLVEVYCSPASDETTAEKTDKANKLTGLDNVLKSKFALKSWKTAFGVVGFTAEEEGRKFFKDALVWIDPLNIPTTFKKDDDRSKLVQSGVKAGVLSGFMLAGDETEEEITADIVKAFWLDFFRAFKDEKSEIKEVKALKIFIEEPTNAAGKTIERGGNLDKAIREHSDKQIRAYAKRMAKEA